MTDTEQTNEEGITQESARAAIQRHSSSSFRRRLTIQGLKEFFRGSVTISVSVTIAVAIAVSIAFDFAGRIESRVPSLVVANMTSIAPDEGPNTSTRTGQSYWQPYLDRWERQYGVPANILWAVILNESGGQQYVEKITRPIDGQHRYARGLFQVVDHWGRFLPGEDPFDPDINAREGIEYLRGCNGIVTLSSENWQDTEVLRSTFACYHAGANGNWHNPDVQRYARNVLAVAGRYEVSFTGSVIAQVTAQPSVTSDGNRSMNDCHRFPQKICNFELDWKHGWCSYHTRYKTQWVSPNDSIRECVERGTIYEYNQSWGE